MLRVTRLDQSPRRGLEFRRSTRGVVYRRAACGRALRLFVYLAPLLVYVGFAPPGVRQAFAGSAPFLFHSSYCCRLALFIFLFSFPALLWLRLFTFLALPWALPPPRRAACCRWGRRGRNKEGSVAACVCVCVCVCEGDTLSKNMTHPHGHVGQLLAPTPCVNTCGGLHESSPAFWQTAACRAPRPNERSVRISSWY